MFYTYFVPENILSSVIQLTKNRVCKFEHRLPSCVISFCFQNIESLCLPEKSYMKESLSLVFLSVHPKPKMWKRLLKAAKICEISKHASIEMEKDRNKLVCTKQTFFKWQHFLLCRWKSRQKLTVLLLEK